MEPILYFIFSFLISYITFSILRNHTFFTKRSIFKNILKKHLNAIYNELEDLTRLPYTYYVGETNDFICELADKISMKLRRKGFKVVRDTNEATCEVLLIS